MPEKRTWNDNLNNVYRDVLFADTELKECMAIPESERDNIAAFRDRYFVRSPIPDEIVTDEKVRVAWYTEEGTMFGDPHVRKKYLRFDIYCHQDELYTYGVDKDMSAYTEDSGADKRIARRQYLCVSLKI